jgi:hypothetical protein
MVPKKRPQTAPPHRGSPSGSREALTPRSNRATVTSRPMTSRLTKDHSETRMSFINGCQAD